MSRLAHQSASLINILLVDDQPRNLDALVTILEAPDRNLVRARDANEALRALLEQEFALIVLDIQMPEISGIELAHIIKQRERTQNIPIIFLTAVYQDEQRMLEGYGIGAVDYLTKPVNPKVLSSKVGVFVDLYQKNKALAQEVAQRVKADEALRHVNEALEERVNQRTAELSTQASRSQLLSSFATELLKTATPGEIFSSVFKEINRTGQADAYYVHMLEPRSSKYLLNESSVSLSDEISGFRTIDAAGGAFETLQTAIWKALGSAPNIYPITAGNTVFGAFTLIATGAGKVGEGERQFIRTACDMVAAVLERGRLIGELRDARDRAERAGKTKDEFLAALSHELRTPLNPVLLIASEGGTNAEFCPEARAQFDTIRKNIELEARLIDDLLDLTRLTHGKLILEKRPQDIHRVIQDAVETVRMEMKEKGIAFHLKLEAEHRVVAADHVRLQQVLWNLLRNAIKFTPAGGSVAVDTRNSDDNRSVLIAVTDTGIGLSQDEIARIFEAFTQGDHAAGGTSHRFGGLGLGLNISRTLAGHHGGTLRAESEGAGHGATFIVELPVLANAEVVPTHTGPVTDGVPSPRQVFSQIGRVLLVEDHDPTRKTLEALLRRRNLDVLSAASVAEARQLAGRNDFKILITDIGLPDGTGFDLMEEMRQRHQMRGIALTGYGMEEDLERSRRAGFAAHLTKPIHVQSLDHALSTLLG